MECEPYRHAISAHLDGEEPGVDPALLHRHLATCSACRNWEDDAVSLARAVRVGSADAIPDLTPAILAAIGREPVPARHGVLGLRLALGLVAVVMLVLTGQDVFVNNAAGHVTRELGSFELALGVGFLFAAWRPVRAYGMLPLVSAFMALLVVTTGVHNEPFGEMLTESIHQLQLAGFTLVALLARTFAEPRRVPYRLMRSA